MQIAICSDHAGFDLKSFIIDNLLFNKFTYQDYGVSSGDRVDYPDIIMKVASSVSSGEYDYGIVICGSGVGASIVANKFKRVRAALCTNEYLARYSRLHNDANVLALGSRITGFAFALAITSVWLNTGFDGGQHQKRIDKIHKLEDL